MSYKKILAWEKSHKLALAVYEVTKRFPSNEIYGLTSQLRRASLSVPTNIVEGYSRQNKLVFATFLDTAFGSLIETRYLLQFSLEAGVLDKDKWSELDREAEEVSKILWSYAKSVKNSR